METIKDYSRFRASCNEFKNAFTEKFFESGKLFCHPLLDGVIYSRCSEEEAKHNGLDICRMSDMLLMSADGEEFEPFKIAEARQIAAENGLVYISDLLFTQTFEALDWMIDGKHDTVIVSEEQMKKEGKPYAPVTPLTNVILPFKKLTNPMLYKKGTPENPVVLSDKDISDVLEGYTDSLASDFPSLEIISSAEFEAFGKGIVTDKNESRCMELDKGLGLLDTLNEKLKANKSAFESAGIALDIDSYLSKLLLKAAAKCGIQTDASAFSGAKEVNELKDAFRKLVSEKNGYGFKYAPCNSERFSEDLRAAEISAAPAEEIKKAAASLLEVRPANGAVYNLARALSPADAENIENIAEYWSSSALTPDELGKYLEAAYVSESDKDENGNFCCGGVKASLIMEDIKEAAAKYKLKNIPVIERLKAYCEEYEKESRTYNGTVFDTEEDMKKAMKNEAELADMCSDLSALDEEELKKLRKYIYDMKLDKKTTGKYLLKIKLALNDCEANQIKALCTSIPFKKPEELAELKKKLSEEFDPVVAAPYIVKVDDAILRAGLSELSAMFKTINSAEEADNLEKVLASGKYDKMFNRHFGAKLSEARDNIARKELEKICGEIGTADKVKLGGIRAKLFMVKCREALKAPYFDKIAKRLDQLEEQEAAAVFADIASADKEKIGKLKEIIKNGKFKKEITDKYDAALDKRMEEIRNQEFIKKCETIPTMDKAALDSIAAELESKKYPESIAEKYLPAVAERENALIKAELEDICKNIPTSSAAALDETEAKLKDEKYDPELTKGYLEAVAARRKALINQEADDLCKNIDSMDKAALAELTEKLEDEKFDPEYTKKHFDRISTRINKLENDKLTQMCAGLEKLKKPELEKLTADISAADFKPENTAAYLDKIRKAEIALMKSELESLCKNIGNTSRKELSKLREALQSGDFDKELSEKYILQIDKRTEELIKTELADICRNIANAPKDKLLSMKLAIAEVPEYAEPGKAYVEQIDSRLKQIDKAEFDKQMESIDKMDMEQLEKFMEELENRKPALDTKLYEASAAKCKERGAALERAELDKLCEGCANADLGKLREIREKITEGSFTPEYTYTYIKKLDDAIESRHVAYFSKLTDNLGSKSRAELIVLLEKISKNETGCSDDMLYKYIGKVNAKIRETDSLMLAAKCKNLSSMTERQCFELVKDINEMDIDEATKKRYCSQVELHIANGRAQERDTYVEKIKASMSANNVPNAYFYVSGVSAPFEIQFNECKKFASLDDQYELPLIIHEPTAGHADEAFLLTVSNFYYKGKSFGKFSVDQIERFECKKNLFNTALHVVEKNDKSTEIPCGIKDKKIAEGAAKMLNTILSVLQKDRAAAKLREAEEIRAAEEAKLKQLEEERLEVEAARKRAEEAEKAEKNAASAPASSAQTSEPAVKVIEKIEPIKPIKPIEVVVSPIPEVKPIKHIESSEERKSAETAAKPAAIAPVVKVAEAAAKPAAPAPAVKPVETAAKPAAPVPVVKPVETAAPAPKPAETPKPAEAPKTVQPVPAAKPVARMKFCDQCGAKITSDTAKFCAECGNKLIK